MLDISQVSDTIANGYLKVHVPTRMYRGTKIDRQTGNEIADSKGAKRGNVKGAIIDLFDGDRKELDACQSAFRRLSNTVKDYALLVQPGGPGTSIDLYVPKNDWFFGDLATERQKVESEMQEAVDALCVALPRMIASSKAALGAMAPGDSEYPTEQDIRDKFGTTIIVEPVPALRDLTRASLPAEVLDHVAQGMLDDRETQMEASIKAGLVRKQENMVECLERMANTMAKVRDAEKVKVYDSLATNLEHAVKTARRDNLFKSEKIEKVCNAIELGLLQTPIDALKKSPQAAGTAADRAAKVLSAIKDKDLFF